MNKAKRLIKLGAGVDEKNEFGMTPLMIATTERNVGVVKMLIRRNAMVDARSRAHFTAADLSEGRNYNEISTILNDALHKQIRRGLLREP